MKNDDIYIALINKMLEKYEVDYHFVLEHQYFVEVPRYNHYWMTVKEFDDFEKWAVKFIKKNQRMGETMAKKTFASFNLMWGLSIK